MSRIERECDDAKIRAAAHRAQAKAECDAQDAVVAAAKALEPWLRDFRFPKADKLRAALSALAALETPNDTKEST